MINKKELISNLNSDLTKEYAAMIQYIQHSSMLHGAEYVEVIDKILEHANDEHEHAVILADIIQYLGGIPTVEVYPRQTSLDNREMLYQDLNYEYDALNGYNQRVSQAENLGLFDIGQKLRNIALEEENHIIDLEKALGILKIDP
ncbi:ferritin-like domain-containing protein [Thermoanaerobacterium thermosaccharolyticum]|jgi:bacterioferritin|uniref:Ferritin Dps family protein n=2 Tax=Thermoanaerobacterium thermosaccharolyticum TaxID=1517 RepID=D9TMD2_THETC|nr:ferritin-like domain-containing protein [Thermoanaerobacterium thermosaccharolyticum]ADL67609.1 Ferritin Dps family protein [Thermoanaerobacterium thermosaccharolyticum DSM 571]AST57450.1 ferritin [Thermoanaerobacterium thermosaccharolyticum]KAA5806528.1 ferritin-like domain-containing protein [Thermoanaerobacterium thermosaccharolyticum]PHO06433.1 ferritin [Thermoanaerobacterium thermosaccharolyticum]